MNIQIKATNLELTPAIRSYIEKRAASFEKNTQTEEARLEVEVGKMSEHHKSGDVYRAEMHLYLGKQRFYVTAETSDLYAAIDKVRDELVREMRSDKAKRVHLLRRGGQKIKDIIRGFYPRK
jgi:ribosomal subunit interface protein